MSHLAPGLLEVLTPPRILIGSRVLGCAVAPVLCSSMLIKW